jgi:hypothetical protein
MATKFTKHRQFNKRQMIPCVCVSSGSLDRTLLECAAFCIGSWRFAVYVFAIINSIHFVDCFKRRREVVQL